MKRFVIKHRKGLGFGAAILFLPLLYALSISWIHFQNSRHITIYDKLWSEAKSNGYLVTHYKRPKDPQLFRFYDESNPYQTSYGTQAKYVGYKDETGETVIPAIFKIGASGFYEGFAWVVTKDNRHGFINLEGSLAFTVRADYVGSFFNGRAKVKFESDPFKSRPLFLNGFVDKKGKVVVEMKYYGVSDYVGELDNEYTLVYGTTMYTPIYEGLMDGIDIEIPPFWILFPPSKAQFLDKDGNPVSKGEVLDSINRLKESTK